MTVPQNIVNVQGIGAVTADGLNTYVQTVANLAALRRFPGVGQMQIALQGYNNFNDGGQGFYIWSSTATGPDNGTTVIVPIGAPVGAWLRLGGGTSGGGGLIRCATYVVNGGGSTIPFGIAGQLYFPFPCTITAVTLLADQIGSVVVDIWVTPFGSYPPTSGNSITGTDLPTISSAQASQDTTLSGWTVNIPAGSTMKFNIVSATNITNLTIALTVQG